MSEIQIISYYLYVVLERIYTRFIACQDRRLATEYMSSYQVAVITSRSSQLVSESNLIQWIGLDYESATRLTVTKTITIGHAATPTQLDSTVLVNHWCLYLAVSEANGAGQRVPSGYVRLDMTPTDAADGTGVLLISRLKDGLPNDVVKQVAMLAPPGLLVNEVIDRLKSNGRHRYRYDRTGLGCRYWTLQCTQDLEDWCEGLSPATAVVIRKTWKSQDEEFQVTPNWTIGTFF